MIITLADYGVISDFDGQVSIADTTDNLAEVAHIKGSAVLNDDGTATVLGQITFEITFDCDICQKTATQKIVTDFREIFKSYENTENYTFNDSKINLSQLITDYVLFGLPQRKACRENCKGLCTVCGVDLNQGQCDCKKTDGTKPDNPFSVLKDIGGDK